MPLYQFSVKQTLLEQQVRNVLTYETTFTADPSDIQEAVDEIRSHWATALSTVSLSNDWSLDGVYVRQVNLAGYLGVDYDFTSGVLDGPGAAENVPTQIALLVVGKGTTTPPNRVRTYFAGFTEGHVVDGKFGSSQLGVFETLMENLDDLSSTSGSFVRVSPRWAADGSYVVAANPLTTYRAIDVPATQRRRRIGRGI